MGTVLGAILGMAHSYGAVLSHSYSHNRCVVLQAHEDIIPERLHRPRVIRHTILGTRPLHDRDRQYSG